MNINWLDAESLDQDPATTDLSRYHGILVPGGFGERGIEGKIKAIQHARENQIPFFGICLGMHCAVIEFSRNVVQLHMANSSEFSPNTPDPVIDLLPDQNNKSDKGGTLRLGSYPCQIQKGSLINKIYGSLKIFERHRHRYEVNTEYIDKFRDKGFIYSGMSPDNLLPEIMESKNHNWFIGVQFHPELKSRPQNPHPLFVSFIEACIRKE